MSSGRPSECPRCATPFQCGIDTGACWCAELTLDDRLRAAFAEYYEGCLCPDCLKAIEAERPPRPTVRTFLAANLRRKSAARKRSSGEGG